MTEIERPDEWTPERTDRKQNLALSRSDVADARLAMVVYGPRYRDAIDEARRRLWPELGEPVEYEG